MCGEKDSNRRMDCTAIIISIFLSGAVIAVVSGPIYANNKHNVETWTGNPAQVLSVSCQTIAYQQICIYKLETINGNYAQLCLLSLTNGPDYKVNDTVYVDNNISNGYCSLFACSDDSECRYGAAHIAMCVGIGFMSTSVVIAVSIELYDYCIECNLRRKQDRQLYEEFRQTRLLEGQHRDTSYNSTASAPMYVPCDSDKS